MLDQIVKCGRLSTVLFKHPKQPYENLNLSLAGELSHNKNLHLEWTDTRLN